MVDRNEIASLISEDYDVSPQSLLQEYSRQDNKVCLSGFNEYCESYDVTITESEFIGLMQANTEFLFLESVDKRDERYWSATLHRSNNIPEGYEEYNVGQLPDIGDGDELAGINSPAQDMDMMGQDMEGQDLGAPTGRSTTTDTMSDADGMGEMEDEMGGEVADPRLTQLFQWLEQPTGPEADYGYGDDLEMEPELDWGAEDVGIDDLPDHRRYPEEIADEEEQMITQEEGDGGDRDLDWDADYKDQPDGNVVRTEPMLTGEAQIDEEGDSANLSKITNTVKRALGNVDSKMIVKWIATKAKEHPEIRDQILNMALGVVKKWIASRSNPRESVIRESKFTCQECGHQYTLPDWVGTSSGKQVACPKCDAPASPDMAAPQQTIQPGMMQQPQMQQPQQPQIQQPQPQQMQGQPLYAQPDMGGGVLPDPYQSYGGDYEPAQQGPAPGMQPPTYPPQNRGSGPGQLGGRRDY